MISLFRSFQRSTFAEWNLGTCQVMQTLNTTTPFIMMLSNPLHCCLILFLFQFLMPAKSVIKSDDPEWFFFSSVDYKYSNSKRVNRTTEHGFWKATGNDRKIRIGGTNNVIGTKKTLVFHEGRVPRGAKTNWVIHEYHALTSHESQVGLLFQEILAMFGNCISETYFFLLNCMVWLVNVAKFTW